VQQGVAGRIDAVYVHAAVHQVHDGIGVVAIDGGNQVVIGAGEDAAAGGGQGETENQGAESGLHSCALGKSRKKLAVVAAATASGVMPRSWAISAATYLT